MKEKPVGSCQNERAAAPAATPLSPFHPSDRAQAHATGRAQCRQKRRERGYYHLHRQLNDPLLLHDLIFIVVNGSYWELAGVIGQLSCP